jgi:transposase-like protein
LDALTRKVRENGRTVIVHALVARGVTADGQREVLSLEVVSGEDGAGWLAFLRSLVARGLSGGDGHLRRPRRAGRRDRGDLARGELATV